jgi:hypothetical protein
MRQIAQLRQPASAGKKQREEDGGLAKLQRDEGAEVTSCTLVIMVKNVLGGVLQTCCTDPLTGFYRDGKCNSGLDDQGRHVVCVMVTDEFLRHQASIGNDLITPHPEWGFPGLKPGDGWCVCVEPWKKSFEAGVMAPVRLEATHERALEVVTLEMLLKSARVN